MTVIFDMHPSFGHLHSTYKLATMLKAVGHNVYYIGDYRYFKNLPANIGREQINPFIFDFIEYETGSIWMNMKLAFDEKMNHKKQISKQETIKQYDALIAKLQPDIILVDHHYIQKAVLYYKYRIPVISVQTAPASEMNLPVPPFCAAFIPDKSLYSTFYVWYLWYSYLLRKRIRFLCYTVMYLGENHLSEVKRLSRQTGFPLKKYIDYKHYKGYGEFGLKNIPQLLLSPRDFDFPRPLNNNQYAVGPLLLQDNGRKIENRRYLKVVNRIKQEKEDKNIKLIYCSLGTVNNFGLRNSIKIFQFVVETGRRNPDFRILISAGEFVNPARLLPTPDNVFIFKSIPQKHILPFCDIMIAHGGQNSITECVMNEVPMLIYPYFKGGDLGGNSARVIYHGIGNRGFIEKETVDMMEMKIQEVLHNPVYKSNLRKMKAKFEERNHSNEVIETMNNIVKDYKYEH